VIDTDPTTTHFIQKQLEKFKVPSVVTDKGISALYLYKNQIIDCVLTSFDLEEFSGITLIQKLKAHNKELDRSFIPIVMIGKNFDTSNLGLLNEFNDISTITKPIAPPQLLHLLKTKISEKESQEKSGEVLKNVYRYIKKGENDKALNLMKDKMAVFGKNAPKHLADLLEELQQLEDAYAIHGQRLKKSPEDISILNDLGRICLKLGKFEEAQEYLEKADKMAPGQIERMNHMATMYLHLKRPDKSIEKYREILGVTPENQDIKFDMLQELKENGFNDEALKFCNEVSHPTEMIRFYNNKGVLLAVNEKYNDAISEYQKAIGFYPDFKEIYRIYFNMALAYMKLGKDHSNDAKKWLNECLRVNPAYEKAQNNLKKVG